MRQRAFLKLGVILFSVTILCGCGTSRVEKAKQYMQALRYKDAIPILVQETDTRPSNAEAYYLLGVAHLNTNQYDKAAESFRSAAALDERYNKRIAGSYLSFAKSCLEIATETAVNEGIVCLGLAIGSDSTLRSDISTLSFGNGKKLAKTYPKLSRELLEMAGQLNPAIAEEEEFFYTYRILSESNALAKYDACDRFYTRFPQSKHAADVLAFMADHKFRIGDEESYEGATKWDALLVERFPGTSYAEKAREQIDAIQQIRKSRKEGEIARFKQDAVAAEKKRKNAEIETARIRAWESTGFLDGTYDLFAGETGQWHAEATVTQIDDSVTLDIQFDRGITINSKHLGGTFGGSINGAKRSLTFEGRYDEIPTYGWRADVKVRDDRSMSGRYRDVRGASQKLTLQRR